MHLGTHEIFNGTFKRSTLEKVLKFVKTPGATIQKVMMSVSDEPLDPGEVSIVHVLATLVNPILLETRTPYRVMNAQQQLIGLGLANSGDEAALLMKWHEKNIYVHQMTPAEYNSLVTSTDLGIVRTFGLGRDL